MLCTLLFLQENNDEDEEEEDGGGVSPFRDIAELGLKNVVESQSEKRVKSTGKTEEEKEEEEKMPSTRGSRYIVETVD